MDLSRVREGAIARLLVVASQCAAMPELERLKQAADGLYETLCDPDIGACQPGLPDGRSLLIGSAAAPLTDKEVIDSIKEACRYAARTHATLILALLGHGFAPPGGGTLYFMVSNTMPDDRSSAVDVTTLLADAADHRGVDGVMAILDMCSAGAGAPSTLTLTGGFRNGSTRLAVLMASAVGQNAHDLAFSIALTDLLRQGIPNSSKYLTPAVVVPPLASQLSDRQGIQRFEWDGAAWTAGDVGMWLAPNRAVHDIWSNSLDAEWVRQLTAAYRDTPTRKCLLDALANHRLVALIAPAGQGKSVMMAGLSQPAIAGADTAQAIVFADRRHTLADIARMVSSQLSVRLPGNLGQRFGEARARSRSALFTNSDSGSNVGSFKSIKYSQETHMNVAIQPGIMAVRRRAGAMVRL